MITNLWIMFFMISLTTSSKSIIFCIVLLHLVFSLSLTKSFLVSYAYVSIESSDCILLSSFELKAILLISSVKTFCLSLLSLCYIFNIGLLVFINSFILSISILFSSRYLFISLVQLLVNSLYNFQIYVFFL